MIFYPDIYWNDFTIMIEMVVKNEMIADEVRLYASSADVDSWWKIASALKNDTNRIWSSITVKFY